jgi:hypothetical protein
MDIGTAPRDGRKVLVRRNEEVEPVTVAYWSMAECRFVTPLCNHYHEPTHWMPMPGVSK